MLCPDEMNRFLGFKNVLCLSPHPDDVEYSMGGTILRYPDTTFHILSLTPGTAEDPTSGTLRYAEADAFWLNMSVRNVLTTIPNLPLHIPALLKFVESQKYLEYDAVVGPSGVDSHFEHQIVSQLSWALGRHKPISLLEYRTSSTLPEWIPNLHVELSLAQVQKKIQEIRRAFRTQLDGLYFSAENLLAFHQDFGRTKRGVKYSESYKIQVMYDNNE